MKIEDLLPHLDDLAPTVDTRTAATWLGIGYECLLDAVKMGEAPVEPIRVGRIYRWPTLPLLALLGLGDAGAADRG